jgi:monovalent cation/proton antiporter MnhG/PhaG subunit
MRVAIEILAALLLVGGAGIVALAALGVARLTDPFMRMHAAAKAGAAGAGLLLLGAGLAFGTPAAVLTALAAVTFLLLTAPIASHALGRAAYVAGAPLGAASMADALSGVLHRKVFDIAPGRTLRARTGRAPTPEETQMSAIPEFRRPADPVQHGQPAADPAVLRRILVCLAGGPAQRAAAMVAMQLARPAGAVVTGLSGAGLEPRTWRGGLPVGGAHWAEWLASRSRARMREAAADALAEFEALAASDPQLRAVARHEEGTGQALATLLAGQDLVIVPAGTGPHGPESEPAHETAAALAKAHVAPVLRVRQVPERVQSVLLVVGSAPRCGSLAAGLLRTGLWPAAAVAILPVADYRRGVHEMVEAQAQLLRDHGRRVAVLPPVDLDFEAEDLRARLGFFDAAVVPCLSTCYGGFFDSIRNCAFETTAETVPLILLP